jgi:hypothetical protein
MVLVDRHHSQRSRRFWFDHEHFDRLDRICQEGRYGRRYWK